MLATLDVNVDLDEDIDALIARHLGRQYVGRRYLRYGELEALGLVDNRTSLRTWIINAGFPRGIRIAGARGKTLLWPAAEVARFVEQRANERRDIET